MVRAFDLVMGLPSRNIRLAELKFREHLTRYGDVNPERNLERETCRDYNHPPKAKAMGKG